MIPTFWDILSESGNVTFFPKMRAFWAVTVTRDGCTEKLLRFSLRFFQKADIPKRCTFEIGHAPLLRLKNNVKHGISEENFADDVEACRIIITFFRLTRVAIFLHPLFSCGVFLRIVTVSCNWPCRIALRVTLRKKRNMISDSTYHDSRTSLRNPDFLSFCVVVFLQFLIAGKNVISFISCSFSIFSFL